MWWRKRPSSNAESDPAVKAMFKRVEGCLLSLARSQKTLAAELCELRKLQGQPGRRSQVEELLPVLDRMHEIALVAMGHPDLAQQFGLTSRQRENEQQPEAETEWETPPDEFDGLTHE